MDSVLRQTHRDIEIIIVDDGSTDESHEVLSAYSNRVRTIRKPNAGQAAAINAAFSDSHGEIICLLDADDLFVPEKVAEIVAGFAIGSEICWIFYGLTYVELVSGKIVYVDQPTQSQRCDFRQAARRGRLPYVHSSTSGLSFRRDFLEQLLPVPEELRTVADNYLKFAAMALSEGMLLHAALGTLRVHESNAYTLRRDVSSLKARRKFVTARKLRKRWPFFGSLANHIVADGISDYWLGRGKAEKAVSECRQYLRPLPLQRTLIYAMAARITAARLFRPQSDTRPG
ncbi:MAG: glycosyltransferase [Bryobacteraceae bacterium]